MQKKEICESLPFFKDLTVQDQELILRNASIMDFDKGNMLSGGECLGLISMIKGKLRAYAIGQEGKEITLYRMIEGDVCIMSAGCMLKEITFEVSFIFECDTKVFVIPTNIYNKLNENYSAIKNYTLNLVNSRFSDVMWVLEQYVFTKLATRLAHLLIEHSSFSDNNMVLYTHEELASDLGTAREVVTRMLKQFEEEGLIRLFRGRIEILDISNLNKI